MGTVKQLRTKKVAKKELIERMMESHGFLIMTLDKDMQFESYVSNLDLGQAMLIFEAFKMGILLGGPDDEEED